MAAFPQHLHGLSRDVTLAVLPRLFTEELVTELRRREIEINIGRYSINKDLLVSLLRDVMTQEYSEVETGLQQNTPRYAESNKTSEQDGRLTTSTSFQMQDTCSIPVSSSGICTMPTSSTEVTPDTLSQFSGRKYVSGNEENSTSSEFQHFGTYDAASASFSGGHKEAIATKDGPYFTEEAAMMTSCELTNCVVKLERDNDLSEASTEPAIDTEGQEMRIEVRSGDVSGFMTTPRKTQADVSLAPQWSRAGENRPDKEARAKSVYDHLGEVGQQTLLEEAETSDEGAGASSSLQARLEPRETSFSSEERGSTTDASSIHESYRPVNTTQTKSTERSNEMQHCRLSANLKDKSTKKIPKTHICDECGYTTTRLTNLVRHKRHHTGEKPYMCDQCGYRASQKTNLQMHKTTHTGEKPYLCGECGYRTGHMSSLTRHMRTHKGENLMRVDNSCKPYGNPGYI